MVSNMLGIDQHGRIKGTFAGAVEKSAESATAQEGPTPESDEVFDPNGADAADLNEDGTLHLGLDEEGGTSTIAMTAQDARIGLGELLSSNVDVSCFFLPAKLDAHASTVAQRLSRRWMQEHQTLQRTWPNELPL